MRASRALSNSLALVTRQEESLIGAVTLVVLPLTFLSTALMTADLLPGWMKRVSDFNPVNWAIEAGRSATAANPDWGMIAGNVALYAAGLVLAGTLATQAFRSYQRSVWSLGGSAASADCGWVGRRGFGLAANSVSDLPPIEAVA